MERIKEIVKDIVWLSESSSPTIHDLSSELLHIVENENLYTQSDVVAILNRKDGISELEEE